MRRLLLVIVLLAVAAFGVTFTLKNPQEIEVSYYFGLVAQGPLALFLLAAFAIGVIFGFLANGTLVLRTRHRLRKAQREADRSQRQLDEKQVVPAEEVV